MQKIRDFLAPLTDWIPDAIFRLIPVEVWWLLELACVLAVLLLIGHMVRKFLRGVKSLIVGERRHAWDVGLVEDLESYPAVNGAPSLCVYHTPAWVRLVAVAPLGKTRELPPAEAFDLLAAAVPVLGEAVARDLPRALVWPAQSSVMGFINSFHRCTPTGRREGEATGWVVLAGRAQLGRESLMIGVVLWTREPTRLGRINLEPLQWLDVLRPVGVGTGP